MNEGSPDPADVFRLHVLARLTTALEWFADGDRDAAISVVHDLRQEVEEMQERAA
jgi:hypothetical protein